MVVDDDPVVLTTVQIILKSGGFVVLTATDGLQALQVMEEQAAGVDLVLSDVRMPRMTGPELINKVGQIAPKAKCALMSGFCEQAEEYQGLPFICKPFTPLGLVAKVQEILAGSKPEGERTQSALTVFTKSST